MTQRSRTTLSPRTREKTPMTKELVVDFSFLYGCKWSQRRCLTAQKMRGPQMKDMASTVSLLNPHSVGA